MTFPEQYETISVNKLRAQRKIDGQFYQGNFQFTRISILLTLRHNKWRTLHWYIVQRLISVDKTRRQPALSPAT